ncbi:MAG: hypothetical protein ACO1OB_29665 [Archangium sp.]
MPTFNPTARVSMFIKAEPREVYRSFIEPEQLTKFWLSKASGPLELGKTVEWHFMVEGAVAKVEATKLRRTSTSPGVGKTAASTSSSKTSTAARR